MTQPTQAQIEAAAKAVQETYNCYGTEFTTIACAALEAAAQVGEQNDPLIGFTQFDLDKERKRIEAATIERCAQVAEQFYNDATGFTPSAFGTRLATAIRKLKDE